MLYILFVFFLECLLSFSILSIELVGMSFKNNMDIHEDLVCDLATQSQKLIKNFSNNSANFESLPLDLQKLLLLQYISCDNYAVPQNVPAIFWPNTSLEKAMFPCKKSRFGTWIKFDTIWVIPINSILGVCYEKIFKTRSNMPHVVIAGPSQDNTLLIQKNVGNVSPIVTFDLEKRQRGRLQANFSKGLVGIASGKQGLCISSHSDRAFLVTTDKQKDSLLLYCRNLYMGEEVYEPYNTKAIFTDDSNIFIGRTGPHLFLYKLEEQSCMWGECTAEDVVRACCNDYIPYEGKKFRFNQVHYSKKFPEFFVVEIDALSEEKKLLQKRVTRYAVAVFVKPCKYTFLLHKIDFTRTKDADGCSYTKGHAMYKFDPSQISCDLYVAQNDKQTLLSSPSTRHITMHGYARGLADKVIDLTKISEHYYEYKEIDLYLKILRWKLSQEDKRRDLAKDIHTSFLNLPHKNKLRLFAQTSKWSERQLDEVKKKEYSKITEKSDLFDILQQGRA